MASSIQPYQIRRLYNRAEKYAFHFSNNERKYNLIRDYRQNIIDERLGGRISPFWTIMSLFCITAGIGLGIWAAFNAETGLAGIIDPSGDGTIPAMTVRWIGISISIIGMALGHFIYDSINSKQRDPLTGSLKNLGWLWVLIPAALLYICFQVAIIKAAVTGTEEFFKGALYLPYVALGIALLELIVGAFILEKGFSYLILFTIIIISGLLIWRVNRNAQLVCESYRVYSTFLDSFNRNNPNPIEPEGNNNIRRAIAYYTGHKIPKDDSPENTSDSRGDDDHNKQDDINDRPEVMVTNPRQIAPATGGNGNTIYQQTSAKPQEDLELFIDDNIDDDLTM
jgi:hypothetical protein